MKIIKNLLIIIACIIFLNNTAYCEYLSGTPEQSITDIQSTNAINEKNSGGGSLGKYKCEPMWIYHWINFPALQIPGEYNEDTKSYIATLSPDSIVGYIVAVLV